MLYWYIWLKYFWIECNNGDLFLITMGPGVWGMSVSGEDIILESFF
jgi:hypothetical protein